MPEQSLEPLFHSVWLMHDTSGSGHVWQVWSGNRLVWSHASIEGPTPDALDLWNALARYVVVHDAE
jgi:hypothetical protein